MNLLHCCDLILYVDVFLFQTRSQSEVMVKYPTGLHTSQQHLRYATSLTKHAQQ